MKHDGNSNYAIIYTHMLPVLLLGVLVTNSGCHQPLGGRLPTDSELETHTVDRLNSFSSLLKLAGPHEGQLQTVKFIITNFNRRKANRIIYMDGRFYSFHDEWYWYLRLNGYPALGDRGLSDTQGCVTPRACAEWMKNVDALPMALQFVEDRLYSQRFYDLALADKREIGLGALLYRGATASDPPLFGFRLEYVDEPTAADVLLYFQVLQQSLAPEMAEQLVWLPRSPAQLELAANMVSEKKLLANQIQRFAALATEGEAEIYNSGVTVGRLLLVAENTAAMTAGDSDYILVVKTPPDELPQAAGFISAVPLTALSHLNILARNRGIPSAYVGGIFDDPWIRQLSDGYAPVAVEMQNGEVKVSPLSPEAWQQFRKPKKKTRLNPQAEYNSAPYVVALDELNAKQRSDWQPLIGGKSFGFEILQMAIPNAMPSPVAIVTTRAYWEHMASIKGDVTALLSHPAFQNSARVRYFVLEGERKYRETFATHEDQKAVQDLKKASPLHFAVGHGGGLKQKIRRLPISASALSEIMRELKQRFKGLPHTQGLRFRSSSTVEDTDIFNGAGLYDSNTGFLFPSALASKRDHVRTVERALKKTWASYWNFHAFEERRNAGIDHQSGAMGVVVHARFDDAAELANGVITFRWNFAGDFLVQTPLEQMAVNVQLGALSVTNPPENSRALPETVTLTAAPSASPSIIRERQSMVHGTHRQVLSDDEYLRLFTLCRRVAKMWQRQRNISQVTAQRNQTVTLDLEFRKMANIWGGIVGNAVAAPTLVLKQVRSLAPAPIIPGILELAFPVPKDVLRRATAVARINCADAAHQLRFLRVSSGTDAAPMFAATHFIADVTVVTAARMEVLSPREFYQPTSAEVIVFSDDAAKRLGVRQLRLSEMVCDSETLLTADATAMRQYARQGRVIGREKSVR